MALYGLDSHLYELQVLKGNMYCRRLLLQGEGIKRGNGGFTLVGAAGAEVLQEAPAAIGRGKK